MCSPRHACRTDNTRGRAAAVVDQDRVSQSHIVSHEIAGLVVPDTDPARSLMGCLRQIVDGKDMGLRFHQPAGGIRGLSWLSGGFLHAG
jgi:hypothetical protein